MPLPQGYTLDQLPQSAPPRLPSGYTLDAPVGQAIDYDKPAEPSNLEKLGTGITDFGKGVGAGAAATVFHGGDLLRRATGQARIIDKPEVQEAMTAPDTLPGKAGKFTEQAAEFLVPGSAIARGAKVVEAGTAGMRMAPLLNTGAKAVLEGAGAAAVTGTQTGGDPQQMKRAAMTAGGVAAAIPAANSLVGKVAPAILGKTTGAGEEAIRIAATNPTPEFTKAMRGGTDEGDIVGALKGALGKVKDARSTDYQQRLAQISQQQGPLDMTPVRNDLMQWLGKFRVKATPGPKGLVLDFSQSVVPPAEESTVQQIADSINNWTDTTPLGMDTLKRRISNFYSHTSDVRALTSGLENTTKKVLAQGVPGYSEMTQGYANASDFIKKIEQEFSAGPTAQQGTAIRKVSYALKQNNEYRKALTEALDQFTNSDIKGMLAGYHLKDTLPKGLTGVGSGVGILTAIATHNLTPAAGVAMMASSPRIMGETLRAMSMLKGAGPTISATVPKIAAAATVDRPTVITRKDLIKAANAADIDPDLAIREAERKGFTVQ